MRVPCLRQLAAACRLPFAIVFVILLAARFASAATLAGRVVDPDGRPVAGARVVVSTANGTVADRATSADGRFEIAAMPAGEFIVRIVADGLSAAPTRLVLARDDQRTLDLTLHVSAITESVVVSASHVDVPLSRSADSVTVVTSADLQARQIDTVAGALRLVPGLTVAQNGDRGALAALFPRGGGSNYTLVLVDGMRANAFGGDFDFGHLAVADVERIEIVRGPQSALFGADAVGAVVQIITRRGGRPRLDGLVEGGSQGTVRAAANAAGSSGAWSWGGGAERTRSDGFTGVAPACKNPGACAGGNLVTNDDDRMTHASGTLGWQRADGYDFLLSGHLQRDERGAPGAFGSNPIGAYACVDRLSRGVNDTRQIGSRFLHPWTARVRERIEASYTDVESRFTSPGFLPPFYDPCNFTDPPGHASSGTKRLDARIEEDFALSPELAASAGVEALRERGSSTYITNAAGSPTDITRGVVGSFAELRYVGRERLFVTGGVRLERLTRDSVAPDQFGSRPAFPDQTISSVNPKIAASYVLSGPSAHGLLTRIHASAGTGIRPPTAFEIAFTDNPNLKPERSRSFDAGVEQQFAGGAFVLGATAFLNRYDDLLVTIGSLQHASRYKTDNISNARARGVELSADARPVRAVTLRANYTFLDTEILSLDGLAGTAPPPFKVGDALIRRPRHQSSVDVVYAAGRVTAFGDVTTRSRVLDVEPNQGALFGGLFFSPGFPVVTVGAGLRVARGVEVYARVMNLADRQYEEVFGFPALRRSGIIGIRVGSGR